MLKEDLAAQCTMARPRAPLAVVREKTDKIRTCQACGAGMTQRLATRSIGDRSVFGPRLLGETGWTKEWLTESE